MNIFNKVALRGLKKNRTRTLVTIVGVVLSAAMITAVATFGTSLLNYLINGSIAKYGDWHIQFEDVDSAFMQEQANDNGVSNTAAFENIGYAVLDGAKSSEKPYFFIAGFSDKTFGTLPVTLISGRLPENSSEVVVPSHVAAKAGVKISVGDTLALSVGNRKADGKTLAQHDSYRTGEETLISETEKTYTVVGICDRPGFEEQSAPGYTLITKADTTDKADRFSLFVTLKNPRQAKVYANSVNGTHSYIFNDDVLRLSLIHI